jgi:hypothetical protein
MKSARQTRIMTAFAAWLGDLFERAKAQGLTLEPINDQEWYAAEQEGE